MLLRALPESSSVQRLAPYFAGLVLTACGARAAGQEVDVNPPPLSTVGIVREADGGIFLQTCTGPRDCEFTDLCFPRACVEGRCQDLAPIECSDGDSCTEDFCDPDTGSCRFIQRTHDEDGDGFRAPLPGFAPGAAGACGDDCDDSSPRARPGGTETCDGVDNDCNGVVDDRYEFLPPQSQPMLVSSGAVEGAAGGLTHNGAFFGLSFTSRIDHNQNQLIGLSAPGEIVFPAVEIAKVNSDTYAGPLIWTGNVFATTWEDRRDDNFEIYFNRFDDIGNKLGPDVRVSEALDFSLNPDVIYTGQEYVVVWGDRRNGRDDFRIYGQRIGRDGSLLSNENVDLSFGVRGGESPSLSLGGGKLGMAFNIEQDGRRVAFRSLDLDLAGGRASVLSRAGGVGAAVTANDGQFVVSWHEYQQGPGDAIWAAVVTPGGDVVVEGRRVTASAAFARTHSLVPLGDRLLLIWAQQQRGSYDLFSRMLSADLTPLSEAQQLTFSEGDVLGPRAAVGADGNVGILYVDYASGSQQVYFTSMSCR